MNKETKLPEYETPQVITYTDEQILEELGPAQTASYCNCPWIHSLHGL